MKSETRTVQQLFELDVRYNVPLYQRPYVWNESDQWEPLWEDIMTLLHHQENVQPDEVYSHFLGAIVLDQDRTAPGQIPRYTVIDGQQRLTTMQLLIAAAAHALKDAGAENEAAILGDLVANDPRKVKETDRLKVWPTNANRASFAAVMAPGGPAPDREDDPNNKIDEAFDYFRKCAATYLADKEDDDGKDDTLDSRADRLRITLAALLKVVSITLDQDDNAQVIFETLNARGTPLLSLDLVKNAAFRQAASQGRDTDYLYEHVWQPELDRDYWRQERRQGRLNRPIGELFLMHWLTMRLERVVPATELFTAFRQGVLPQGAEAESLIKELCADAAVMRSFDDPEPNSPDAEFFARFGPLDAGTVLPIVLLLFRSREVSKDRRRRALRILESWLARRALTRLTSKNYNRLVPTLVKRMKADLEHADEALFRALVGADAAASRWPDDAEFTEFLRTREVYGLVSRPRLVMALSAVEETMRTTKSERGLDGEELSLEHLLPQEWEEHWKLTGSDGVKLEGDELSQAAESRTAHLHRLGNLTIVAHPLNPALSNGSWAAKRDKLNEHSVLLLNSTLAKRETWDEQAIEEHGAWLVQRLTEIWPGPESSMWT
ncbi:MAG: DUF262 domain-containing protein [Nocardioidaceae bacterium]